MSKDETIGFLERVLARYDSDGFGIEALIDRASGTMIGWAGLAVPTSCPRSFLRSRWGGVWGSLAGRGLATEVGAAALEFGFTTGGLERMSASTNRRTLHPGG